jgi:DNA-binding CsgD family transcriptional regulator
VFRQAEHVTEKSWRARSASASVGNAQSRKQLGKVCQEIAKMPYVIQQRPIDESAANRTLLEHYLHERRRAKGPLVLVSARVMHANTAAAGLVRSTDHALLWEWASEAAAAQDTGETPLRLVSGRSVAARACPIEDGGLLVGVLVRLEPMDQEPARGTAAAARSQRQPAYGWASLTGSERSVAEIIAEGATNREAAARLYLSRHTIDFHLRQIFRKLEISSRVALTRLVIQHSAADPGSKAA